MKKTHLCVPKVRGQVVALLPELDCDDFVHLERLGWSRGENESEP